MNEISSLPDMTLRRYRRWYILAASLGIASLLSHQPAALAAGVALALIITIPELWYRRAQRHLRFIEHLSARRAFLGEALSIEIQVENAKTLPLPWLEITTNLPPALEVLHALKADNYTRHLLINTFAVGGWQRAAQTQQLFCARRGFCQLEPFRVRTSDPFGWLELDTQRRLPLSTVLIYPPVLPLDAINLPALFPFGTLTTPRRLLDDPLRVAGAREYVIGDDPRLIHWKATARAGALRSKVLDPGGQHRLLVLLDVNPFAGYYQSFDDSLLELSVTVAASIGQWAIDEGLAVGFLSNGTLATVDSDRFEGPEPGQSELLWLPPSNQRWQRERMLSVLARLMPSLGSPIEGIMEIYRQSVGSGTTILLICTVQSLRAETIAYLSERVRHGMGAQLILVGPHAEEPRTPTYTLPVHRIGGKEVWNGIIEAARQRATSGKVEIPYFSLN